MSATTEGVRGAGSDDAFSQSRLRVLLIEDSSDDALLIMDLLESEDYELVSKCVSRRIDVRRALTEESWDVIVSDFRLPGFSALEAFQMYREFGLDIPFIIVSGVISEETAVAAMKLGVHDYISKANLGRLGPAVTRELRDARTRKERREALDALHLAHQELAAIHANAPVALLVVDADLRVEKENEMAARMSGRDASDMLGLRLSEAFDCVAADEDPEQSGFLPACGPCSLCTVARNTLRDGTHCSIESRITTHLLGEKQEKFVLISTAPIEVKGQNKVLVSAQDITDLRRAVSEIESHRDTLIHQSNLINLSHDAIITLASDRVITGWNNGAAETYGWKAEEAAGQSVHTFLQTRNHLSVSEIDAILVQEGSWDGEVTRTAKNGETKLVDSRQVVMLDRTGAVSRILVIDRDITIRKKAEQELSSANQNLSELVDELRVTLRERDVLLREVQHRVKNNLQVISSLLALEADRCIEDQVSNALHDSRDRVRSMALIHEKFCRSSSMTEIDFNEYVESLAQSFWSSHGAQMAGVRRQTEVDVYLDIDQAVPCGLIVQELFSNSMKHAFKDGDGGEIRIEFHKQAGEFVLVYRDSGIGLPADINLKEPGSLGLQLITDLICQLGGHVTYEYADGALFTFRFPSERGRGIA